MISVATAAEAADQAITGFNVTAPPAFWEVLILPAGGRCTTSGGLEIAIRETAAKKSPPMLLDELSVELKGIDSVKGSSFVVRFSVKK